MIDQQRKKLSENVSDNENQTQHRDGERDVTSNSRLRNRSISFIFHAQISTD